MAYTNLNLSNTRPIFHFWTQSHTFCSTKTYETDIKLYNTTFGTSIFTLPNFQQEVATIFIDETSYINLSEVANILDVTTNSDIENSIIYLDANFDVYNTPNHELTTTNTTLPKDKEVMSSIIDFINSNKNSSLDKTINTSTLNRIRFKEQLLLINDEFFYLDALLLDDLLFIDFNSLINILYYLELLQTTISETSETKTDLINYKYTYFLENYLIKNKAILGVENLILVDTSNTVDKLEVPILCYHNFKNDIEYDDQLYITEENFEDHLKGLQDDGYTTVSVNDLINYVKYSYPLPEKPILITIDDGYIENYDLAYPLLKKYGSKATIFVIGWSYGRNSMLYSNNGINEHFGKIASEEMLTSGIVEIESHTYDMHGYSDSGITRPNIRRVYGESMQEYVDAISYDIHTMANVFQDNMGYLPTSISYPYGIKSTFAEKIYLEKGFLATFILDKHFSDIQKGNNNSLINLRRMVAKNVPYEVLKEEMEDF